MDDELTPCATLGCGESSARYGAYCGFCLDTRREFYEELVSGEDHIVFVQDIFGITLRVPSKYMKLYWD